MPPITRNHHEAEIQVIISLSFSQQTKEIQVSVETCSGWSHLYWAKHSHKIGIFSPLRIKLNLFLDCNQDKDRSSKPSVISRPQSRGHFHWLRRTSGRCVNSWTRCLTVVVSWQKIMAFGKIYLSDIWQKLYCCWWNKHHWGRKDG